MRQGRRRQFRPCKKQRCHKHIYTAQSPSKPELLAPCPVQRAARGRGAASHAGPERVQQPGADAGADAAQPQVRWGPCVLGVGLQDGGGLAAN